MVRVLAGHRAERGRHEDAPVSVAGLPGRRVASHVPLGAGPGSPSRTSGPRGQDGGAATTRASPGGRSGRAARPGRRWLVRRVRARRSPPPRRPTCRHLAVANRTVTPSRTSGPRGPLRSPPYHAPRPLRSGRIDRYHDPTLLAERRSAGTSRCVGASRPIRAVQRPDRMTVDLAIGRPVASPSRGRPTATSARARSSRWWAGARHLHLVVAARDSRVADRGSAVRSRPASSTLRRRRRCCPGVVSSSQDGHRMSTARPQSVPRSCVVARTRGWSRRAVDARSSWWRAVASRSRER